QSLLPLAFGDINQDFSAPVERSISVTSACCFDPGFRKQNDHGARLTQAGRALHPLRIGPAANVARRIANGVNALPPRLLPRERSYLEPERLPAWRTR